MDGMQLPAAAALTARYGARAGCLHGPDPDGGYTVHSYLPVIRND